MLITSVSTQAHSFVPDASSAPAGSGGFLVCPDGRELPLLSSALEVEACGGVATVVLRQRFQNPYAEPLAVTYTMPLPVDGAVSGYAFVLADRRITGQVDRKARARERYEEALAQGRTAGLLEQDRENLFTQELGNVPPHSELTAELRVDQRLTWLSEGRWEWRFPLSAGPRYMGAAGRVSDEARNTLAYATTALPVTATLALDIRDTLTGGTPDSTSHALRTELGADAVKVAFAQQGGAPLDRDVVVRWTVARPSLGFSVDVARPAQGTASLAAYGLLSVVPPEPGCLAARPLPRDVCLLLDISGSMSGSPLEQVKAVCERILDALVPQDRLELVAFSSVAARFAPGSQQATPDVVARARAWVRSLRAGGGTEMVAGIVAALAPLGTQAQRQVVLLTDGYVGFEQEVVRTLAEKLPQHSRFHVVGVGAAVNRALTRPASRAGRGVELILAPQENAAQTCGRLMARLNAPIAIEVTVEGSALLAQAPERMPDVFAGSPLCAALKLRTDGGTLRIRARTAQGLWEQTVNIPAVPAGHGPRHVPVLYGREMVADIELRDAYAPDAAHGLQVESLGLEFQIATAHTSWVAISDEVTVDPTRPTRASVVPQQLPHGVSAAGLGLRAAQAIPTAPIGGMAPGAPAASFHAPPRMRSAGAPPPAKAAAPVRQEEGAAREQKKSLLDRAADALRRPAKEDAAPEREPAAKAKRAADASSMPPPPPAPASRRSVTKAEVDDDADMELDTFAEEPAPAKDVADATDAADSGADVQAKRAQKVVLLAVVRSRTDRTLVLGITTPPGGLTWTLPLRVLLHLADGRSVQATVDAAQSTAAAQLGGGMQLRLCVTLAAELGAATVVGVTSEDWSLQVTG